MQNRASMSIQVENWQSTHRKASQVRYGGRQPRLRASTYTMPHRLMVAGLAYCRSATCAMRSPASLGFATNLKQE